MQDHDQTIDPEGEASMRWRAVLESLEEPAEASLGGFLIYPQNLEDLSLHVWVVDPDGTAAQLHPIEHDVVSPGDGLLRVVPHLIDGRR